MKLIALMGCSKFGNTTRVVRYFAEQLEKGVDCEIEYVYPADYKIDFCVGCHNCIFLGETKCPHHSQYAPIEKKMMEADGLIIASPGYMFSVMGVLKNFLDHTAYNCHRPKYFGRKAFVIGNITKWQEKSVMGTMETYVSGIGYELSGSTFVDMLPFPLEDKILDKKRNKLDKAARVFAKRLNTTEPRKIGLGDVPVFHAFRNMSSLAPNILKADRRYFEDNNAYDKSRGWYVPAKLSLPVKLLGPLIGRIIRNQLDKMINKERLREADGRTYNELHVTMKQD